MVEYATRADFTRFANEMTINEQASLRKSAESRSPNGSTFLSHSSKDDDLVVGAISVLEGHGASVYIDKKDPLLPPYTNRNTAKTLKMRISQTKKFVLLASENSKASKWVPWELGIADEAKGIPRIAVFPTVESTDKTAWTEWEYLGLYRRIVWGKLQGYRENIWMVWDLETDTATALTKWLAG
ncbi:MAG: hypothetical protein Pars2KO_31610 [Parasphingorhabdus sp.]